MTDYKYIAERAWQDIEDDLPPEPRSVESIRPYLYRVLELLPTADKFGYCKAPPGGENSVYLPSGTFVRVARVVWPNGQIVKIQNDVPNGGPQWVEEDVQPELYVPYTGESEGSGGGDGGETPEPPDGGDGEEGGDSDVQTEIRALWVRVNELEEKKADKTRVEDINLRVDQIDKDTYKTYSMPDYKGSGKPDLKEGGRVDITSRPATEG